MSTRKNNLFYCVIITLLMLTLIVVTYYSENQLNEKNRTINNLQDELVMLKEENRDVMDLNAQLMEEIEEVTNEE